MNNKMGRKPDQKQGTHRFHLGRRVLALVLTLMIVLTSSGMQIYAEDYTGSIGSDTVTEEVALEQSDATEVETVTETTQTPAESTTPEESTVPDQSTAPEETTTVDAETPANTETPAVEETTPVTTVVRKAAAKAAARSTSTDYDITNLLTNDSYIEVAVDGKYYTLDKLEEHSVEQGAAVKVHLEWDAIPGIQQGQKLVYQIPTDMVTNIVKIPRQMFADEHGNFAGYLELTSDGLLTVEIDESYFNTWSTNQQSDTLELDYLKVEFGATLAMGHGETSGNDDNVIRFKDETEGEPKSAVEFEIPFVYPNEIGRVNVEKSSNFDAPSQTITYTVKVSTPSSNSITSTNVKLTDAFTAAKSYLNSSGLYTVYQNPTATLYTNTSDGTNLTGGTDISDKFTLNSAGDGYMNIGDMDPDSVVVLTYQVKVNDKYFSTSGVSAIANTATVNFNDNGVVNASTDQSCSGMVTINKAVGDVTKDSAGNYYIPYTVTVTATGDKVTGVKVVDELNNPQDLVTEVKDFAVDGVSVSESVCSYDADTETTTWNIGAMEGGTTTVLTYKGYIDVNVFDSGTNRTTSGSDLKETRWVKNTASLYVGDELYGQAVGDKSIEKTWVSKVGKKNSDGTVDYTLRANNFPMSGDVEYIWDNLSGEAAEADSDAYIALPITVKVYSKTTSGSSKLEETLSVNESTSGFAYNSDKKGWTLDLKTAGIDGAYYYEITYTVKGASGVGNVDNGAGIGLGSGTKYGEGTSVEVKEVNSSKELVDLDYVKGVITWKSTMMTDIDAGTVFLDFYDDDKTKAGVWWFTQEDIDGIEILYGDEVIYSKAQGINTYDVTVELGATLGPDANHKTFYANQTLDVKQWVYSGTNRTSSSCTTIKGYNSFQITFGQAIPIEKEKQYVTIRYTSRISAENLYQQYRNDAGSNDTFKGWSNRGSFPSKFANRCRWTLSTGLTRTSESNMFFYRGVEDVIKGAYYDEETGIITWKVFVNRQGDMSGEATVVDTIPDNLTYIDNSLTLTYGELEDNSESMSDYIDGYNGSKTIYANNTQKQGNIKSSSYDESTRQLTVQLENLLGFSFKTSSGLVTSGTNSVYSSEYGNNWWGDAGVVTLTYQTRIDDLTLIKGGKVNFTNTATVTSDTMAFGGSTAKYTESILIPNESENLTKTMNTYAGGDTLTFNLSVNPNGANLIYNNDADGNDTITVKDVMNDKLNLDLESIEITDGDGNTLTQGTDYTVTKVETTDGSTNNTYEFVLPDSTKLSIQYEVIVDGAIGEEVTVSNKAYFDYEGLREATDAASTNEKITISESSAGMGISGKPQFSIHKIDQDGNPVANVTFKLYKVPLTDGKANVDSNGNVILSEDDLVDTQVTDNDGDLTFGVGTTLDAHTVYCFVEVSAPAGYEVDSTQHSLYFYYQANTGIKDILGISYSNKTYEITNNFSAASLTIPVKKTINGANKSSEEKFTFSLEKTSGYTVHSTELCRSDVVEFPVTTTVTGSGTVNFETLYFSKAGTYEFKLTENELTDAQKDEGFAGDSQTYTIQVVVKLDTDGSLVVDSATATSDNADATSYNLLAGGTPIFNNTLTLTPATVTLKAYKTLTGDVDQRDGIKEGEFEFIVYESGKQVATGKTAAAGEDGYSEIVFDEITYTQEDMGDHILIIREKAGTDDSITYSTKTFFATVKVDAGAGGTVTATVTYQTSGSDHDGYPLFENQYIYTEPDIVVSGVHVDFVPYVLVAAAVVVVGAGAGVVRWRRRKNED